MEKLYDDKYIFNKEDINNAIIIYLIIIMAINLFVFINKINNQLQENDNTNKNINIQNTENENKRKNEKTESKTINVKDKLTNNNIVVPNEEEIIKNTVSDIVNNNLDPETIPESYKENKKVSASSFFNKLTNKTKDVAEIEKQKSYSKYNIVDIYSGNEIVVSKDGQQDIVKLINISDHQNSPYILQETIKNQEEVFIEFDTLKQKDGKLLGYVWINIPNPDNINQMLNYVLSQYDSIDVEIEQPNMKYANYFNKKESKNLLNNSLDNTIKTPKAPKFKNNDIVVPKYK